MQRIIFSTLFSFGLILCSSNYSYAASALALKICSNTTKGTLVARTKCLKGETTLKPTSFTGPAGAMGSTGARGASAFEAIPSGTTVYGVIGNDVEAPLSSGDINAFASLPAKTSQVLVDSDVLLAPTAVLLTACTGSAECRNPGEVTSGAVCTGSAATPTAPAGKVCIYVSSLSASKITAGTIFADPIPVSGTPTITPGFRVGWTIATNGDTYLKGTWAYTAP